MSPFAGAQSTPQAGFPFGELLPGVDDVKRPTRAIGRM